MKAGMDIHTLSNEIERQSSAKRDFIAPTDKLEMTQDAKQILVMNNGYFGLTNNARRQLAEKLEIPFSYFERLQEKHPDLLSHSVNTLMHREPSKQMVRILDGNIRAVLSDRYRTLDNYDLADAVLPVLADKRVQFESCNITETKLYIKVRMPWLDRELPVPENLKMGEGHNWFIRKIEAAMTISNSEVGAGKIAVNPGIFEKQCTNLATFKEEGYGRMHIGKMNGDGESVSEYLSDATKKMEDAVVWAKIRDIVVATMDGRVYDNIAKKLYAARGDVIKGDPAKVVEVFGKKNGLNEGERGSLLRHLAGSGEMSRYGLQWAVTRLAGDVESYDRASELERLGGQVIELASNDWEVLAKAA